MANEQSVASLITKTAILIGLVSGLASDSAWPYTDAHREKLREQANTLNMLMAAIAAKDPGTLDQLAVDAALAAVSIAIAAITTGRAPNTVIAAVDAAIVALQGV